MRIEILGPGDRSGIDRFSIAVISGAASFDEVRGAFHQVATEHGGRGSCFLTLDSLHQCLYTSTHARHAYGLDGDLDSPADESAMNVAAYELQLFRTARQALDDPARRIGWSEMTALETTTAHIAALLELNRRPDLLLEARHVVQCVPGSRDDDALANIPNGYFEGDWSPFQTSAVVNRICQRHSYSLLGIGASTLTFLSTIGNPSNRNISALVQDLQYLYGHPQSWAWSPLAETLAASPILILGYTDNFADRVGRHR